MVIKWWSLKCYYWVFCIFLCGSSVYAAKRTFKVNEWLEWFPRCLGCLVWISSSSSCQISLHYVCSPQYVILCKYMCLGKSCMMDVDFYFLVESATLFRSLVISFFMYLFIHLFIVCFFWIFKDQWNVNFCLLWNIVIIILSGSYSIIVYWNFFNYTSVV